MSNEIYILTECRAVYLEVDIIFKFKYFVFISRFSSQGQNLNKL